MKLPRKGRSLSLFSSQLILISYLFKWLLICLIIGSIAGTASAGFLLSLQWATEWREQHFWIICLLPLAGLLIGLIYHYYGQDVSRGNNQLLEEFHNPKNIIPFKMAPMIWLSTVLTHLVGGSAGREGTAVQMGGSLADQLTHLFKFKPRDRKVILIAGIAAGFASVFGTPLAGTIFGLEVMVIGQLSYTAILPSLLSAVIADYMCRAWNVGHTHYHIDLIPALNSINILWTILAGIVFGIVAMLFSWLMHKIADCFKTIVNYAPLRPLLGGAVLVMVIAAIQWLVPAYSTRYLGLGVPVIVESFKQQQLFVDFAAKILFTAFTLGAGFKGGEVTPLFFIGATLGSALSLIIPLPVGLLAGMGFVSVFAGAANTPLACIVMGLELFGIEAGVFIALACIVAFLFSGNSGIYTSQRIGSAKHILLYRYLRK
ncbi:voltage-gated chloride channel family protein [Solitalea sp. MAHUQ-68]|uniref:Voltage-gated chloride channel family protein n=1 Tax=Solitalea agri TaxID=2953739 RepID=A0A9X2F1H5_9SPHI|nr:voltage-gated chloride channel family protein [Solitalea agri]MCO4292917.1 voltage-gated chloride channel family protein [Solitalea agri]